MPLRSPAKSKLMLSTLFVGTFWLMAAFMLIAEPAHSARPINTLPYTNDGDGFSSALEITEINALGTQYLADSSPIDAAAEAEVMQALFGTTSEDFSSNDAKSTASLESPALQQPSDEPAADSSKIRSAETSVGFDADENVIDGQLIISTQTAGSYTSAPIRVPLQNAVPFIDLGSIWQVENPAYYDALAIALNVRGSIDGEQWTDWRHYEEFGISQVGVYSDLTSFDKATRFVQFQFIWDGSLLEGDVVISGGTLVFISPGETPESQMNIIESAQNDGSVPVMPMSVNPPNVVSRTTWGCPQGQSSPSWPPTYTTVTHLIIHHTVTDNFDSDWPARVRSIWQYHTFNNGWGDIGYNYLIDPNGVVYEGRAGGDRAVGGHFCGQNGGTMGVAMLGTFTSAQPTQAARNALTNLLAWKAEQYGINPTARSFHPASGLTLNNISGHRDGCQTACPGDGMYALIPGIRASVGAIVGSGSSRPGVPIITAPVNNEAVAVPFNIVVTAGTLTNTGRADFHAQIDNNSNFGSPEFDNVALNGIWSANTTIPVNANLQPGTYYLRVQQGDTVSQFGDWTSSLQITVRSGPANDVFANATVITALPRTLSQDAFGATVSTSDPTPSCSTGGRVNTVWYRYTPATTQALRISTGGSGYDTILAIYSGNEGGLSEVACGDDLTANDKTSLATFIASAGTTYDIMIAKWNNTPLAATGTLMLNITAPANDVFTSGMVITPGQRAFNYDLYGATVNSSDPSLSCIGGKDYANSVWFRYTPTANGAVSFTTPGNHFNAVMGVFTGSEGNLNEIGCNDNFAGTNGSLIRFDAAAGTTYHILLAKRGTASSLSSLMLTLNVNLPTLLAPAMINNTGGGNPTYLWADINAPYFYLVVQNSLGQQIINEVITRSTANCDMSICQIDPVTELGREAYRLNNDTYSVWLNTWQNGGYGAVAGPYTFTLDAPPPALASLDTAINTNTLRPTIHWSLPAGNARLATSFMLYVAPANNLGAPAIHQRFTRIAACGSAAGNSCAVNVPVDLTDGVLYNAFVQSCGAGGCTVSSGPYNNGYAGTTVFTVDAPTPDLPSNLVVNFNQGLPTISWNDDPDATSFNVYIGTPPNWAQVYSQTYPRAGNCDGTTCRVNPLIVFTNRTYNFAVQGIGTGGASVGGIYNNGYGVLENQTLNLPIAAPPSTGFAPIGNSEIGRPTFEWATVPNAISYQLWVGKVTPTFTTNLMQWYWAAAPDCTPHPGTCRITPPLNLPAGSYAFNVQTYGSAGLGAWGMGVNFTIGAPLPGLVTLLAPSNTISAFAPTFTWVDAAGVEWYNVWVGNPQVTVAYYYQWVRRADVCSGGTCALTPALNLVNGAYLWNVQASNPAGVGAWTTTGRAFTIAVPTPNAPLLIAPADEAIIYATNRPTFTWNTVANSQGYFLQLLNGVGAQVYGIVHYSGDPACNAATCTVQIPNLLAYGAYRWRVVPGNINGAGGSSLWRDFVSLSVNTQPMMAQADDPLIVRDGLWNETADDGALADDLLISAATTNTLTLTFTGTQVDVVYVAAPGYGTFALEIDGVTLQIVDASAAQITYGKIATLAGLAPGQHTLRIVTQGIVAVDAVSVDGQIIAQAVVAPPTPESTPEATAMP